MPTSSNVPLVVGDRIRISVALLRDWYDRPDHESPAVRLVEVRIEPDGTKVLVVARTEES